MSAIKYKLPVRHCDGEHSRSIMGT